MHVMKEQWSRLQQAYEELAIRERVLLVCACLAGVYCAADALFLHPMDLEHKRLRSQHAESVDAIDSLVARSRMLSGALEGSAPGGLDSEERALNRQIEIMNARIEERMASMIPPSEVTRMLEELLSDQGDLALVKLTSIEPAKLPRAGRGADAAAQVAVEKGEFYRHAFVIELEGSYFAALHYLESIERLPWDLSWDRITYEVTEYPRARVSIQLHTLSREENWIGV